MIKPGFSYLKLTGALAVLAMSLVPVIPPSMAKNHTSPAFNDHARPLATIRPQKEIIIWANEPRAISRYFDDLVAYVNELEKLSERKSLEHIHINPVQLKSDNLKSRLPEVQNAVREIVRKLKAANQWNDLNTTVAEGVTDASQKSFLQQIDFKRLLEDSSTSLSSRGKEISGPLDNLRKRLVSRYGEGVDFQIVRAGYAVPEPIGSPDSLGCTIGKLGLIAIKLSGGKPTNAAFDAVFHQCWPAGAVSPF
jgi:hypothetical protein